MYLKLHSTPEGDVVALCDAAHMGKVLIDGKRRLDLSAYASFYKGAIVSREAAVKALCGAKNANIVGKKSLDAARAAGLDVSGAISIAGVPHLHLYKI